MEFLVFFKCLKITVLHRFLEKPNSISEVIYDDPNQIVKLLLLVKLTSWNLD